MEAIGALKTQEVAVTEGVFGFKNSSSSQASTKPAKKETGETEKSRLSQDAAQRETRDKIERIAQAMDNYVKSTERDLEIQVHQATGNIMVKVISKEDGRIVREIPPEEMLNLAAKMEQMVGFLFDENV